MTQPNQTPAEDELDKILERLNAYVSADDFYPSNLKLDTAKAKAAIQAYTARQVTAAQLETAKYFKGYMISTSPFITEIVDPYIAELKNGATS